MKALATIAFILTVVFAVSSTSFGQGIDITPICADDAFTYNLVISQNDVPVVVWSEGLLNKRIKLKYWSGKKWLALGDSASSEGLACTGGYANCPSIAAKDLEHVYLTWMDENEIYMKFWNGKKWGDLSGKNGKEIVSNTKGESKYPDIAIDSDNKPYVLWNEEIGEGKYAVYLKYWNGGQWGELGQSSRNNGIDKSSSWIACPKISIDKANRIFATWDGAVKPPLCQEGDGIFVRYWSKDRWSDMAGSFIGRGINPLVGMARNPTIAHDNNGNPVVVWDEDVMTSTSMGCIYLLRWDGNAWMELGGSASGHGISLSGTTCKISIAFTPENNPIVAWGLTAIGNLMQLYQWDGSKWSEYRIATKPVEAYSDPMIANDTKGNIYVSWLDRRKDIYFIRMRKFCGSLK